MEATGWAVVDETLGDFFGLNDSKYQWAVDEYFKEHEQVRPPTPLQRMCSTSRSNALQASTTVASARTDARLACARGAEQKERRRELRKAAKAAKAAAEASARLRAACETEPGTEAERVERRCGWCHKAWLERASAARASTPADPRTPPEGKSSDVRMGVDSLPLPLS